MPFAKFFRGVGHEENPVFHFHARSLDDRGVHVQEIGQVVTTAFPTAPSAPASTTGFVVKRFMNRRKKFKCAAKLFLVLVRRWRKPFNLFEPE